ncbi:hypothetical protein JOB18_035754, partial [Solea senegalensis]
MYGYEREDDDDDDDSGFIVVRRRRGRQRSRGGNPPRGSSASYPGRGPMKQRSYASVTRGGPPGQFSAGPRYPRRDAAASATRQQHQKRPRWAGESQRQDRQVSFDRARRAEDDVTHWQDHRGTQRSRSRQRAPQRRYYDPPPQQRYYD